MLNWHVKFWSNRPALVVHASTIMGNDSQKEEFIARIFKIAHSREQQSKDAAIFGDAYWENNIIQLVCMKIGCAQSW